MLKAVYAEPGDFDFMRRELILGARKKHYGFTAKDPYDLRFLEDNIRSAIQHHRFTSGLRVEPILFMKNHTRVGMVMMSELSPGQGGNEIHLAFVAHKQLGKGYGSEMIDRILEPRQVVDVYARCAIASQRMYEMLDRRGFNYQYTDGGGFRILFRPKKALVPCLVR